MSHPDDEYFSYCYRCGQRLTLSTINHADVCDGYNPYRIRRDRKPRDMRHVTPK